MLLSIRLSATVLPTCRRHRCILSGILTSFGYPLAFLLAMWKEHKKHWWKNSFSWDQLSLFRHTIVRHYYGNFNFLYTSFNQLQDRRPDQNQSCDVIGWKKCRRSKFPSHRRKTVSRKARRNGLSLIGEPAKKPFPNITNWILKVWLRNFYITL